MDFTFTSISIQVDTFQVLRNHMSSGTAPERTILGKMGKRKSHQLLSLIPKEPIKNMDPGYNNNYYYYYY
jgi:hypothetical protein